MRKYFKYQRLCWSRSVSDTIDLTRRRWLIGLIPPLVAAVIGAIREGGSVTDSLITAVSAGLLTFTGLVVLTLLVQRMLAPYRVWDDASSQLDEIRTGQKCYDTEIGDILKALHRQGIQIAGSTNSRESKPQAKLWSGEVCELLRKYLPGEVFAFETIGDFGRQFPSKVEKFRLIVDQYEKRQSNSD